MIFFHDHQISKRLLFFQWKNDFFHQVNDNARANDEWYCEPHQRCLCRPAEYWIVLAFDERVKILNCEIWKETNKIQNRLKNGYCMKHVKHFICENRHQWPTDNLREQWMIKSDNSIIQDTQIECEIRNEEKQRRMQKTNEIKPKDVKKTKTAIFLKITINERILQTKPTVNILLNHTSREMLRNCQDNVIQGKKTWIKNRCRRETVKKTVKHLRHPQ